jgi:hypothetical protein
MMSKAACPPDLGRRPSYGELISQRPMCQAHYCGWCCGCAVCRSADREWIQRSTQAKDVKP